MVVCVPVATVYREPALVSEQADELLFGEEVEIIGEKGGFCHIKSDYGYEGWVIKQELFEKLHDAAFTVTVPFADLHFEGSDFRKCPITLPMGARIDVGFSESEKNYGFAVLPSKRIYYIRKSHIARIDAVKGKSEPELREAIAATALKYLGVQYRWGGRSFFGVDCSGLCFNAYRFNGVNIWRDADIDRSPNLRRIPLEEAKTGDLVFFNRHVALYLGEGEIVHASASEGFVKREKLFENENLMKIYITAGTLF